MNAKPTIPFAKDVGLRRNLIAEEAGEFDEAAEKGDLAEIAKELADILVVVYGAAVTYGIDMEDVWRRTDRFTAGKTARS